MVLMRRLKFRDFSVVFIEIGLSMMSLGHLRKSL